MYRIVFGGQIVILKVTLDSAKPLGGIECYLLLLIKILTSYVILKVTREITILRRYRVLLTALALFYY